MAGHRRADCIARESRKPAWGRAEPNRGKWLLRITLLPGLCPGPHMAKYELPTRK